MTRSLRRPMRQISPIGSRTAIPGRVASEPAPERACSTTRIVANSLRMRSTTRRRKSDSSWPRTRRSVRGRFTNAAHSSNSNTTCTPLCRPEMSSGRPRASWWSGSRSPRRMRSTPYGDPRIGSRKSSATWPAGSPNRDSSIAGTSNDRPKADHDDCITLGTSPSGLTVGGRIADPSVAFQVRERTLSGPPYTVISQY